jgi:secreted trypsin-like serine protease
MHLIRVLFSVCALLLLVSFSIADDRIVNGDEVSKLSEAPFIAQFYSSKIDGVMCGGTIIDSNWILTAAHCEDVLTKSKILIGSLQAGQGTEVVMKDHFVHPNFRFVSKHPDYDFMLVELQDPIDFSSTGTSPITLTDESRSRELLTSGKSVTAMGWGDLKENGQNYPKNLNKVKLPIVSNDVANGPNSYNGAIDESMIAAGYANGGKDACDGDSGGPLLAHDSAHEAVLVGVVSWGNGCAEAGQYGIYANVAVARSWIEDTIRANR